MNYYLTFLLLVIGLFSCTPSDKEPTIDADTKAILNLGLAKAVGADSAWREYMRIPPPFTSHQTFTSKEDSLEYVHSERWRDSVKATLDTATLFVVVYNRFESLDENDRENIHALLREGRTDLDTGFAASLHALSSARPSLDSFPLNALEPTSNYKLYTSQSAPKDKLRRLGSISFSMIGFNTAKDKACVYTRFICGGLCGTGQILFFNKKEGRWLFVKSWEMWIS